MAKSPKVMSPWKTTDIQDIQAPEKGASSFSEWASKLNDYAVGKGERFESPIDKELPSFSLDGGGRNFGRTDGGFVAARTGAEIPLGLEGALLRFNVNSSQMKPIGGYPSLRNARVSEVGGTLVRPSGDEYSLQWHDQREPVRDNLPGAFPQELGIPTPPSRGWRFNWTKPF